MAAFSAVDTECAFWVSPATISSAELITWPLAGISFPQVMDLLRLLVEAGPNPELRRLLFSNFPLLISFLKVDAPPVHKASPGGRHLVFARPVSCLMGAVVDGDLSLMTSITEELLTQLARKAARSRRGTFREGVSVFGDSFRGLALLLCEMEC